MQTVAWMALTWFAAATVVGAAVGSLLRHLDRAAHRSPTPTPRLPQVLAPLTSLHHHHR